MVVNDIPALPAMPGVWDYCYLQYQRSVDDTVRASSHQHRTNAAKIYATLPEPAATTPVVHILAAQ